MNKLDLTERTSEALKYRLDQFIETTKIPGASLSVLSRAGVQTVCAGSEICNGPIAITETSTFALAALAKLLTARVMLHLAEHKKLDLDAPIANYLPELLHPSSSKA